jgi:hypothetical protein
MHTDFGPNGRGILGWLLDNVPAVVVALSAASAVLTRYKRRTFWVWLFAASAFLFTFFSEVSRSSSEPSQKSDSYGETHTTETEELPEVGR